MKVTNMGGKRYLIIESIYDAIMYGDYVVSSRDGYFKDYLNGTETTEYHGTNIRKFHNIILEYYGIHRQTLEMAKMNHNILNMIYDGHRVRINDVGGYCVFDEDTISEYSIVDVILENKYMSVGDNNILILENDNVLPDWYKDMFEENEHPELQHASIITNFRHCVETGKAFEYINELMSIKKDLELFVYTTGLDEEQFGLIHKLSEIGIKKYTLVICGNHTHVRNIANAYMESYDVEITVLNDRGF